MIDSKIKQLREITSNWLFIEYYSHTNCDMYKILNEYTKFNEDKVILSPVHEGIEKSLDLAIEYLTKQDNIFNSYNTETLPKRILKFIDDYAGIKPDWCEIEGIDEKYTSPDAYDMLNCANMLINNKIPDKCWSEWGCGGYSPYTSKEGKEEHDILVKEIYFLINKK